MIRKGRCPTDVIEDFRKSFPHRSLSKTVSKDPKTGEEHDVVFTNMTPSISKQAQKISKGLEPYDVVSLDDPYDKAQLFIFDQCVIFPKIDPEEIMSLDVGDIPEITSKITLKSGYRMLDFRGYLVGGLDPRTTLLYPEQSAFYPEEKTIKELKEKYNDVRLWQIVVGLKYFIVKPLSRKELREANETIDPTLSVLKSCCLYPRDYNWEDAIAGLPEALASKITDLGGYDLVDVEEIEL